MNPDRTLRNVMESDQEVFFDNEQDPIAIHMAAFTAKDPFDRGAFLTHWNKILDNPTVLIRTIQVEGCVAGSVLSYEDEGHPEVSYWLGREYWNKGLATWALSEFLAHHNLKRPIYARAAKDNLASLRVLEKNGFQVIGESRGYANARGEVIAELLLELKE